MRKIITLMLLVFMLASCQNKEPFKLGFVVTLSGQYAKVGISELYGVQKAVDEINESGGINGRLVELEVRDDEGDPELAVQLDNELKEMGIDIIIGHSISIVALDAVDNANANDILLISPSIGTDSLTGLDDNLVRVVSTTFYEGHSMAEGALKGNPEKVMFIYNLDNYVLTQHHKNGIEEHFQNHGFTNFESIGFESGNHGHIEYIEEQLNSGEFDTVIISSSNVDASIFVNYVKTQDLDMDIHLGSWAASGILERIDTVDTERIYSYFGFVERLDDSDYMSFKTEFEDTYGQPVDMLVAYGYDSVYVLKEAIEYADSFDIEAVKSAIIEIGYFEGVSGEFTINEFGDSVRKHYMMKYEEGQTVLVG